MKTVIEMAKQAGIRDCTCNGTLGCLERFADLVRADAIATEREACAKVAEDSDHVVGGRGYYDQLGDADATVRNIVAAIRARGTRAYDRYEGGST